MASFQFGPWVIWAVMLEFVLLLFLSMWQKRHGKGSDPPRNSAVIEDHWESLEAERISPTMDQIAVVDAEIDSES